MKILIAIAVFIAAVYANECEDELMAFRPNPDDCQAFFMCMLGQRVDFRCDQDFIFDAPRRRCRLGSAETCEFRFGPEPSCEDELLLFHHREDTCTEFFMCMLGRRVDFTCEADDIFDITRRRCVPGDDFLCQPHDA
ncbi:hypothetical protein PVAND_003491 [Polypedilum vanderplanki]|uniref:Chitin-binding type-2 domain-containing protein n=1 Tax=Polypedilum vanderplanki TaxID=319348 RepID=A0A9J6BV92_POLVA|nr:hypothetical protein PVAND_003491 [Polypedilum vanderplanki]